MAEIKPYERYKKDKSNQKNELEIFKKEERKLLETFCDSDDLDYYIISK